MVAFAAFRQNIRYSAEAVKKAFTDIPPATERADRPVVKEPNRTCNPMAAFNAYPDHLAFETNLSFSRIAVSRVGCRRSPTVSLPPGLFRCKNELARFRLRIRNVTHFFFCGYYPVNCMIIVHFGFPPSRV